MLPTLVKRPVLVRLYSMTRFRPVTLVIANAAPVPRWTSLILDHRMSVAGAAPRQGERVETGQGGRVCAYGAHDVERSQTYLLASPERCGTGLAKTTTLSR
jgi:hypothetical protein